MPRNKEPSEDKTTFEIMDAQSVRNSDAAAEKAMTRAKKVSEIKRYIVAGSMEPPKRRCVERTFGRMDEARRF
jgi:hypothetical protein